MQRIPQEASTLQAPLATALRARRSRRATVQAFFLEHLSERFGTMELHQRFGTGFRGRKSEINDDPQSRIRIFNETTGDTMSTVSRASEAFIGQNCAVRQFR